MIRKITRAAGEALIRTGMWLQYQARKHNRPSPREVIDFMYIVFLLTRTPRWMINDADNTKMKKRTISTAEHEMLLCMLGLLVGLYTPGIQLLNLIFIFLFHDLVEGVWKDTIVHHLSGLAKAIMELEKERGESKAKEIIAMYGGSVGRFAVRIANEYDSKATHEAKLAGQVDKVEASFEAAFIDLYDDGFGRDVNGVIDNSRCLVTDRFLLEILNELQRWHRYYRDHPEELKKFELELG